MSSSAPNNHHYLPVFYLEAWTGDDGRLFRYYRPYRDVVASPITPPYTACEEGLYTLADAPPEHRQVIESQFMAAGVDSPAALVTRKLLDGGVAALTGAERVGFARFVMSLELRGPQAVKELSASGNQVIRENSEHPSDAAYLAARKPGDPDTLYEWAQKYAPQYLDTKRMLPGVIDNPVVGQHLINMSWAMIDVSVSPCSLLTSDRPLFRTHGLDSADAVWALPLSPTHLFVAANSPAALKSLTDQPAKDTVERLNNNLVRLAVQYVYGNSPSQLAFVEERLRRVEEPVIPGIAARAARPR